MKRRPAASPLKISLNGLTSQRLNTSFLQPTSSHLVIQPHLLRSLPTVSPLNGTSDSFISEHLVLQPHLSTPRPARNLTRPAAFSPHTPIPLPPAHAETCRRWRAAAGEGRFDPLPRDRATGRAGEGFRGAEQTRPRVLLILPLIRLFLLTFLLSIPHSLPLCSTIHPPSLFPVPSLPPLSPQFSPLTPISSL